MSRSNKFVDSTDASFHLFTLSFSLKSGMVITIEPGIYVPPTPQFPKRYHNLGIRIEDEVLVGEKDPTVLTVAAPKEVSPYQCIHVSNFAHLWPDR
jgi:Xaa-Pro aminopeptidase